MFVKRSLSLRFAVLEEPVLRLEEFAGALRAQDLLSQATAERKRMLTEARAEGRKEIEQAIGDCWIQANLFLQSMETEREYSRCDALNVVEGLLEVALTRLLDGFEPFDRVKVLLRELANNHTTTAPGTLSCHPNDIETVRGWLTLSQFAGLWELAADASLPNGQLRLIYANGAFDIDWDGLRASLLGRAQ